MNEFTQDGTRTRERKPRVRRGLHLGRFEQLEGGKTWRERGAREIVKKDFPFQGEKGRRRNPTAFGWGDSVMNEPEFKKNRPNGKSFLGTQIEKEK